MNTDLNPWESHTPLQWEIDLEAWHQGGRLPDWLAIIESRFNNTTTIYVKPLIATITPKRIYHVVKVLPTIGTMTEDWDTIYDIIWKFNKAHPELNLYNN